jgi:hypothetical protein
MSRQNCPGIVNPTASVRGRDAELIGDAVVISSCRTSSSVQAPTQQLRHGYSTVINIDPTLEIADDEIKRRFSALKRLVN